MKPDRRPAVALVLQHKERLIEERLLGLGLTDAMLVRAFPFVAHVPTEADDARPIDHARIL